MMMMMVMMMMMMVHIVDGFDVHRAGHRNVFL